MSSSVQTYSYSVTDGVSNVAFKFVNADGYELCTASVPVIVDGSILVGQDGYEVSIENDAWAIPCDSNNIITGLTYTNGVVETSPVSAYSGNTKLNITSIKINNVELANDTSYSVNGCRLVINGKKVNGYYQEIYWVRVTGDTNSDSVYNVDNAITKIPFTITFNGNDGNSVTRVKYINVYRINSGAPGISPVVYKLNIHNDTISGTYSNDSYSWSESDFSGSIIRKIGNVTRTIENTAELNAEGLKLYAGTTLVSNGSASQFTYTGGQFTTKGSYGVAGLFNVNQAARGFTFYLKDSNNNVQDSEDVTYVLDGQKGEKGDAGSQGLQGCVIRTSLIDDGTSTTKYRNDENLATTDTRYIDIVGSSNPSATDGFDWYKVRPANGTARVITGVATMRNYIANYSSSSVYLEKLNDVGGIYASFILAKNAKIKFLTNNELTVVDSNNNPVAGITGGGNVSGDDSAVRIWAGNGAGWDGTPWEDGIDIEKAAFKVYEDGSLVAQNADVVGQISGSNGQFATSLYGPKGSFGIRENGSGWAAFGNIRWDENGKVEIINATFTDCYGVTGDIVSGGGNNSDIDTLSNVTVSNINFSNNTDVTKVNATFTIKNSNSSSVIATLTLWSESEKEYLSSDGNSLIPCWTAVSSGVVKIELSAGQTVTRTITYNKNFAHNADYSSQPLNGKRESGDLLNASWIRITDVVSADSQAKPATWGPWSE